MGKKARKVPRALWRRWNAGTCRNCVENWVERLERMGKAVFWMKNYLIIYRYIVYRYRELLHVPAFQRFARFLQENFCRFPDFAPFFRWNAGTWRFLHISIKRFRLFQSTINPLWNAWNVAPFICVLHFYVLNCAQHYLKTFFKTVTFIQQEQSWPTQQKPKSQRCTRPM